MGGTPLTLAGRAIAAAGRGMLAGCGWFLGIACFMLALGSWLSAAGLAIVS